MSGPLDTIRQLLADRIGLGTDIVGSLALENAIKWCMQDCGSADLDEYVVLLRTDVGEFQCLVNRLTVGESWFMRDSEPFVYLGQYARDKLAAGTEKLNVLSLPCAAGEEAYSIAITLLEAGLTRDRFSIEAVDINTELIAAARKGVYSSRSLRLLTEEQRHRYFCEDGGDCQVADFVRESVDFRDGNLFDASLFAGSRFDVIFCRNLFIYFNAENQNRALGVLKRLMANDGLLFLGHADINQSVLSRFVPVDNIKSFCFRARQSVSSGVDSAVAHTQNRQQQRAAVAARLRAPARGVAAQAKANYFDGQRVDRVQAVESLANAGRLNEAWNACVVALEEAPGDTDLLTICGVVQEVRGEPEEAGRLFEKALDVDASNTSARAHLVALLEGMGQHERAAAFRAARQGDDQQDAR